MTDTITRGASTLSLAAVAAVTTLGPATARAQCSPADESCPAWELGTTYTGKFWRNLDGGLDEGDIYVDNLDVTLALNGEKLLGVPGLTLFAYGIYNNGHDLSGRYVGDAQGVSNIAAVQATRLYELWAELNFGSNDAWSVRAGLYDLNSEFAAIDTAGLFINSAHGIGTDIAQTGENGPSIFPIAGLGARLRWQAGERLALQAVVLDAVPGDPEQPDRTKFDLGDGSLLVAEAHWYGTRIAKANLGYWRYSPSFDELGGDARRDDNAGWYASVDGLLYGESGSETEGLRGWLRYGVAEDRINAFESHTGAGLVYTGLLPGRSEDQLGLAVAIVNTGTPFREAVAGGGGEAGSSETNIELTYRFAVNDWLTLQPDIQYVIDPGADPSIEEALVVGLRFEVGYGWAAD